MRGIGSRGISVIRRFTPVGTGRMNRHLSCHRPSMQTKNQKQQGEGREAAYTIVFLVFSFAHLSL